MKMTDTQLEAIRELLPAVTGFVKRIMGGNDMINDMIEEDMGRLFDRIERAVSNGEEG